MSGNLRSELRREWRKDKGAAWNGDNYIEIIKKRTPETMRELLEQCWGADTAYDMKKWSKDRPSTGQCAVTALVVQDSLEGSIIRVENEAGESHYYNRVNGFDIDITRDQFDDYDFLNPQTKPRNELLNDWNTKIRYWRLRLALEQHIAEIDDVVQ